MPTSSSNQAAPSALQSRLTPHYAGFALMNALFVVPQEGVMSAAIVAMLVVIVALYWLRKQEKSRSDESSDIGVLQAQYLITLFWRFSLLCLLSVCIAGVVVSIWGDSAVLGEMNAAIASGQVVTDQDLASYIDRYKAANVTIGKIGHVVGFVPLAAYVYYRLWRGWGALKAGLLLSPKSWRS